MTDTPASGPSSPADPPGAAGGVGGSLYNRHRPQVFADMVGQDHVARALMNALGSGAPPRAYLFSGPRGTGKTTIARILARCLNCMSTPGPTAEPCGRCDSCLRTGHEDWLDVLEVDAASSARRIDEMRDWLDSVRYPPVAARYRITIMDEAHQIQPQAASALLKTLEEPPSYLIVILCTTEPWDILATIRSRLQHFALRRPGVPDLVRVLDRVSRAEGIETTERALDIVARAADGSYRDGLGLLEQVATYAGGRVEVPDALELIGAVSREAIFELVELVAGGHSGEAIERLESSLDSGTDPEQLMRGLVAHLRYLFLLQQGARARDEWGLVAEEIERLQAQTHVLAATQVVRTLDLLADAQLRIRNGADARMQLELVAAKLGRPALDPTLEGVATRVANLERGARQGDPPGTPAAPGPDAATPVSRPSPPESAAAATPDSRPPPDAQPPHGRTPPPSAPAQTAEAPQASAEVADAPPVAHPPAPEPPPAGHPPESVPPESGPAAMAATAAPPDDSAPGPVPADHVDLEHVERAWPGIMSALQEQSPSTRGFLDGARVLAVEPEGITIGVPSAMRVRMLEGPEHRRRLAQLVSLALGGAFPVTFEAVDTPASAPVVSEAPGLSQEEHDRVLRERMRELFGAVEESDDTAADRYGQQRGETKGAG